MSSENALVVYNGGSISNELTKDTTTQVQTILCLTSVSHDTLTRMARRHKLDNEMRYLSDVSVLAKEPHWKGKSKPKSKIYNHSIGMNKRQKVCFRCNRVVLATNLSNHSLKLHGAEPCCAERRIREMECRKAAEQENAATIEEAKSRLFAVDLASSCMHDASSMDLDIQAGSCIEKIAKDMGNSMKNLNDLELKQVEKKLHVKWTSQIEIPSRPLGTRVMLPKLKAMVRLSLFHFFRWLSMRANTPSTAAMSSTHRLWIGRLVQFVWPNKAEVNGADILRFGVTLFLQHDTLSQFFR
jgi:hypothetical protein